MRILVVDDDVSIRDLVCLELELEGHSVTTAEDGSLALALINLSAPDLVVMDVMMPVRTGWEVLEQLRASPQHRSLPVILLSARDVQDDVRRGYELGASAVLSKPYDAGVLARTAEAVTARLIATPPTV